MNQFPKMLYKAGGVEEIHGGRFSTLIVQDGDELEAALAGGWALTTPEATAKAPAAVVAKPEVSGAATGGAGPGDNAPPTRDELKQKAAELGLTYAHNISNVKLAELVEAALAGGKD